MRWDRAIGVGVQYRRPIILVLCLTVSMALLLSWYLCCSPYWSISQSLANLAGTTSDGAGVVRDVLLSTEKQMVVAYEKEDGVPIGTVIWVYDGRYSNEQNLGVYWRARAQELSDNGLVHLISSGHGGSVYRLTWKGYLLALVDRH